MLPAKAGEAVKVRLIRQVESSKKYNEWESELLVYLQEDFREVFYLPENYRFVPDGGFCGSAGYVEMEFEHYKYSLKSEITSRYHSRVAFEET
jgi:hypothetical protein